MARLTLTGVAAPLNVWDTRPTEYRSCRSVSCAKIGGRMSAGTSLGLNEIIQDALINLASSFLEASDSEEIQSPIHIQFRKMTSLIDSVADRSAESRYHCLQGPGSNTQTLSCSSTSFVIEPCSRKVILLNSSINLKSPSFGTK
jgi:hypothetical protein